MAKLTIGKEKSGKAKEKGTKGKEKRKTLRRKSAGNTRSGKERDGKNTETQIVDPEGAEHQLEGMGRSGGEEGAANVSKK